MVGTIMNTITDKIFLAVFSGFVLTITTASVVVARNPHSITPPGGEAIEETLLLSKETMFDPKAQQVTEEDFTEEAPGQENDTTTLHNKITVVVGHEAEVAVQGTPVVASQAVPSIVGLSPEQLRFLINELKKPEPAKNMPLWKKSCMWTWKALSISYNVLMKIPAGLQIVLAIYFVAKYKPEWLGLALKEGAKTGVLIGANVTAKVGEDVAESLVKAIEKNTPQIVAKPVRHVVEEAARKHAEWAENSSMMQELACWAGYGCEMPPLDQ